jgi:hypothetical protein
MCRNHPACQPESSLDHAQQARLETHLATIERAAQAVQSDEERSQKSSELGLGSRRVLDDRTPYRNALLFSVDARFATW